MYLGDTRKNPISEYKYLLQHNPSRMMFLGLCVGMGIITWEEYYKFREQIMKEKLCQTN